MPEPGESIAVATLPNLRDLGGWVGADGRTVRRGLVYRSTDLSRLDQTGRRQIAELGVRTVYDLRSAAERSTEPDVRLDGVAEVVLDVLADAPHAVPGNLTALLSDPTQLSAAQEVLGGKSLNELMTDSYAQLITLPSARESYRRLLPRAARRGRHPGTVPLHHRQGPHGLGRGLTAERSRGVPRGRVHRVSADQ